MCDPSGHAMRDLVSHCPAIEELQIDRAWLVFVAGGTRRRVVMVHTRSWLSCCVLMCVPRRSHTPLCMDDCACVAGAEGHGVVALIRSCAMCGVVAYQQTTNHWGRLPCKKCSMPCLLPPCANSWMFQVRASWSGRANAVPLAQRF